MSLLSLTQKLNSLRRFLRFAVCCGSVWEDIFDHGSKETWALICWLVYAYYLHVRLQVALSSTLDKPCKPQIPLRSVNLQSNSWSVIAKELSRPCRPYNVAKSSPREGIETSKCELGMPFIRLASSTGSKPTKPAKRWTKDGSPLKTSKVTRKLMWWRQVANLGVAAHEAHEPTTEYLRWEVVAQAVR
eukprot:6473633-Amphidinium_carterae.1